MTLRILPTQAIIIAIATAALPLFPITAAAQIAVSSNDGKAVLVNGVTSVPENPVDDTISIINLGVSP
ncbi:MAG: YncE family protein, partial [Xanthobacteraceae bacterium]